MVHSYGVFVLIGKWSLFLGFLYVEIVHSMDDKDIIHTVLDSDLQL